MTPEEMEAKMLAVQEAWSATETLFEGIKEDFEGMEDDFERYEIIADFFGKHFYAYLSKLRFAMEFYQPGGTEE